MTTFFFTLFYGKITADAYFLETIKEEYNEVEQRRFEELKPSKKTIFLMNHFIQKIKKTYGKPTEDMAIKMANQAILQHILTKIAPKKA